MTLHANLANVLTLARIVITPGIVFFLFPNKFLPNHVLSVLLATCGFFLASLSDYLDGYLARKYKWVSGFGEFLDPLADKILTISMFISFLFIPYLYLPKWTYILVFLIVFRDAFITFIRMKGVLGKQATKTQKHGKVKTVIQIVVQSVFLALILQYALVFNSPSFSNFIGGLPLPEAMNLETLNAFQKAIRFYPHWLFWALYWTPIFLLILAAYYTLRSGLAYLRQN